MAREIVAKGLTVRDVERLAREATAPTKRGTPSSTPAVSLPPEGRRIEDELRRYLQTDVHLALTGKDKGSIRINFYSAEDLERLLELMLKQPWEAM
jgi:ParB family chromosome partitioning protein